MLSVKYQSFQNLTQLTSKVPSAKNSVDDSNIELCSGLVKMSIRSGPK